MQIFNIRNILLYNKIKKDDENISFLSLNSDACAIIQQRKRLPCFVND